MSKLVLSSPLFPSDLFQGDFEHVYEPAEDTFLLMDAIEADLDHIVQRMKPLIALEVGCGSGAIITSLSKALGPHCLYMATDINRRALDTTAKCSLINGVPDRIHLVQTNLTDALIDRLEGSVDILIFNPPYVPTPSEEVSIDGDIFSSWAGGKSGLEVTIKFVHQIGRLLSRCGRCYLVALHQNDPEKLIYLMSSINLAATVQLKRKCGIEQLYILRISKT